MKKKLLQAKHCPLQPLHPFLLSPFFTLYSTSGLTPQDAVGIWAECHWNGLSKDTSFTRCSLCAPNEKGFSNKIFNVSESYAAMQTHSNYCCGVAIALPKSCFNNMKCSVRRSRQKHNKKHWCFFSVESVNTTGNEGGSRSNDGN